MVPWGPSLSLSSPCLFARLPRGSSFHARLPAAWAVGTDVPWSPALPCCPCWYWWPARVTRCGSGFWLRWGWGEAAALRTPTSGYRCWGPGALGPLASSYPCFPDVPSCACEGCSWEAVIRAQASCGVTWQVLVCSQSPSVPTWGPGVVPLLGHYWSISTPLFCAEPFLREAGQAAQEGGMVPQRGFRPGLRGPRGDAGSERARGTHFSLSMAGCVQGPRALA